MKRGKYVLVNGKMEMMRIERVREMGYIDFVSCLRISLR